MMRATALILLVATWPASAGQPRLVVLHSVENHEVIINAAQVTSLRPKLEDDDPNKLFTKGVACMISLTDGRYAAVIETCDAVQQLIDPQLKDEQR